MTRIKLFSQEITACFSSIRVTSIGDVKKQPMKVYHDWKNTKKQKKTIMKCSYLSYYICLFFSLLGGQHPYESIICIPLSDVNGITPFTINAGWHSQQVEKENKGLEHWSIKNGQVFLKWTNKTKEIKELFFSFSLFLFFPSQLGL